MVEEGECKPTKDVPAVFMEACLQHNWRFVMDTMTAPARLCAGTMTVGGRISANHMIQHIVRMKETHLAALKVEEEAANTEKLDKKEEEEAESVKGSVVAGSEQEESEDNEDEDAEVTGVELAGVARNVKGGPPQGTTQTHTKSHTEQHRNLQRVRAAFPMVQYTALLRRLSRRASASRARQQQEVIDFGQGLSDRAGRVQ